MSCELKPNKADIRFIIENSKQPVLFKNILNWELLKWDLSKWNEVLQSELLQFRCGLNANTEDPQWETTTAVVKDKLDFLLKYKERNPDKWLYFDYKYLRDWFKNIPAIKENVSWELFGFPEYGSEESTIWIGTEGAHTPCHMDTYGYNLIAQIYGRKQWILFPPEENLQPTRVPYEESSIFSKLNFFSPTMDKFKGIDNCRTITLNPGDVLFLPHGWWHYVENLDLAISVNIWLPMNDDNESRLKESVVQMFVTQIIKDLSEDERKKILCPGGENDNLCSKSIMELLNMVKVCWEFSKDNQSNKKIKFDRSTSALEELGRQVNVDSIIDKYDNINIVPKLSTNEFLTLLEEKSNRFKNTHFDKKEAMDTTKCELSKIINSIVNPEVIDLVINKLLSD